MVSMQTDAGQMLVVTCRVGDALFAIDTARIQEAVRAGCMTPVDHAPDFVRGVMNLRGRIVTVIDLARKLDLEAQAIVVESRILIVDWMQESVGLLVEEVGDVLTIDPADLRAPPENMRGVQGGLLRGVYASGGILAAVLDVDSVLAWEPGRSTG